MNPAIRYRQQQAKAVPQNRAELEAAIEDEKRRKRDQTHPAEDHPGTTPPPEEIPKP
jgi:hypothetical protein